MEILQVSGLVACVMKERKRRLREKSHRVSVRNVVRLDFNWEQQCEILGEDRFLRAYRMKRDHFNIRLYLVERHLSPERGKQNGCSAVGSSRRVTPLLSCLCAYGTLHEGAIWILHPSILSIPQLSSNV